MQFESVCGVGGLLDTVVVPVIVAAGLTSGLAGVLFYIYKKRKARLSNNPAAELDATAKAGSV